MSKNSEKKPKKVLTPEEKKVRTKKRGKIAGVTILCLVIAVGALIGVFAIVNVVDFDVLIDTAKSFEKVDYSSLPDGQLVPVKENDGYWTFTLPDGHNATAETDNKNSLKIMQLTDIHIGAGFSSLKRDGWAMNAVAAMISAEKPDLVVITGDLAYPVPFQAGTFNNLNAAKAISTLMEQLGVYWTFTFGNHDTESYSMYTRENIADWYEGKISRGEYKYCLFQKGKEFSSAGHLDKSLGNSIIKVKNADGNYVQAIVTIDSNSYLPGDATGIAWNYDNIHQDQIDWYATEMDKLRDANNGAYVPNLAFFHIPLYQMRDAYNQILEEKIQKGGTSADGKVTYRFGVIKEKDPYVFPGEAKDKFFETGQTHGLKGIFTGHDHLNNLSVDYDGVRLTYGMSIDYLAYIGIYKDGAQRGCTVINATAEAKFGATDIRQENYYQAKYPSKYPKEKVNFAFDPGLYK